MSSAFRYASRKAAANTPANGEPTTWEIENEGSIDNANRIGSLEQVIAYCRTPGHVRQSHWGLGVWTRPLIAAAFSLLLQWGTTSAAVIVVWFSPTKGKLLQHFFAQEYLT